MLIQCICEKAVQHGPGWELRNKLSVLRVILQPCPQLCANSMEARPPLLVPFAQVLIVREGRNTRRPLLPETRNRPSAQKAIDVDMIRNHLPDPPLGAMQLHCPESRDHKALKAM